MQFINNGGTNSITPLDNFELKLSGRILVVVELLLEVIMDY